ncbi:MAG: autotransporter assembly complex family protein [Lysobacterales bacterium]
MHRLSDSAKTGRSFSGCRSIGHFLLIGCWLAWAFPAGALELNIEGGTKLQQQAVLATAPARRLADLNSNDGVDFWIRRLSTEGSKALQPTGYYEAEVTAELNLESADSATLAIDATSELNIVLEPGEPVKVTAVDIRFGSSEVVPAVSFPLPVGAVLDHSRYEAGKQAIAAWLLNHGYLSSKLLTHEVRVNRGNRSADIALEWEPGPRFRFGEVSFTDSPLDKTFLQRYVTLSEGDYFSESRLQTFSQGLRASGYFAAVEIVPGTLDLASATVPIEVQLTPRKQSAYQAGVIYATDAGPGIELGAERRWLNDQGYQARVRLELASRRSLAAARVDLPSASDLNRSLSLSLNYVDESTDSSDRNTARAAVSRLSRWGRWNRVDALTYLVEDFQIGSQDERVGFLLGSVEVSRSESDGSAVPRSGWRASAVAQLGADSLLSETDLGRIEINGKTIYGVGEDFRVLLRGQLGALWASDFSLTPASLRFFAGGDRSVRGFDFEELSPRNVAGEPLGGEYVAVASAEFDGPLAGKFRWAAFVDAGNAFGTGEQDVAYSAGIGLRWLTPIGPLRLDIASALTDADSSFKIHFSAGPDL